MALCPWGTECCAQLAPAGGLHPLLAVELWGWDILGEFDEIVMQAQYLTGPNQGRLGHCA